MSGFHFPGTDREERLGKLKFGADWEDPQTKADLELLSWFCDPLDIYSPLELHDIPPTPLEGWIYRGRQEKYQEASDARLRALTRRRLLAEVRALLKLYDKYGPSPNVPAEFEPLKPWEDREKLAEARRLIHGQSESTAAEPKVPLTGTDSDQNPVVPKSTRKRGPKSSIKERVKSRMVADIAEGRITPVRLNELPEKEMAGRYDASRDTCRKARDEVLKEIKRVRH
jgi:hypothetical protein